MHVQYSKILNDGTCTGGWFRIHSRNIPLVRTVNHCVNDCTHLNFIISTLDIVLANIHRDVLVLLSKLEIDCSCDHSRVCSCTLRCGGCRSMQQSGLSLPFVFVCAFFMTFSHPFSIVAFTSGINIAWDERSFVCASRFPEACVSERQISRVIWTIPNSRFPKFADQNHIRSSYFLLPRFTLESISYSPDLFRVTWRILSHRYEAFDNSPTISSSSFFFKNWWSAGHGVETLYSCSTFLFANSQYLPTHLFSMLKKQATLFAWDFTQPNNFGVAPAERDSSFEHLFAFLNKTFVIYIHEKNIPKILSQENDVRSPGSTNFNNFFHIGLEICPSRHSDVHHAHRKNRPCFRCTNQHSQLGTFSILGPTELFQIVLSPIDPANGWPYRFASRGTTDLRCLTKISAVCVVVNVSKYLDIVTLKFSFFWERALFWHECKLMLRRLLVQRFLAALQWHPCLALDLPCARLLVHEDFCLTDTLCRETRQHVLAFTFREN